MSKVRPIPKPSKARHFIRQWRQYRGLTLEQLAERIDVTHGALSQLERGLVNYTQPMLEALAYGLRCTPADLLMRDPMREDAAWSIVDHLKRASPDRQRAILRVVSAMFEEDDKGTGTDG